MAAMVNEALDDERWPAEARLAIRILRDRVSELEDAIGLTLIKPHRYFPDLGLDPICEKILGILIRRPSVSRDVIFMTLWGDKAEDDQPQAKTIDVHLVQIRAALDEINILDIRTVLARLFYATVIIAKAYINTEYLFAF